MRILWKIKNNKYYISYGLTTMYSIRVCRTLGVQIKCINRKFDFEVYYEIFSNMSKRIKRYADKSNYIIIG